MKILFKAMLLLLFCFTVELSCSAQADNKDIYTIVEQMPEYPGGPDSLLKDIISNVEYPKQCADSNIQGKVVIKLVVNDDGSTSDMEVLKSPHPLLSAAAINALKTIKKFNPGKQHGKEVKVWYTVPINFKVKQVEPPVEKPITTDGDPLIEEGLNDEPGKVHTQVDQMPEFPGGDRMVMIFLTENIRYPAEARAKGIEDKVGIRFIVDVDGSVKSVEVTKKSISPALDAEAVRVVSALPKFTRPAMIGGKPVKSYYNLPVVFSLY